jgi:pimeloyl-ACP methyl ester carboxylesterase
MTTQFLQISQNRIAYDDLGKGPLVICSPSLGDVRAEFRFLAPILVKAGYRVVVMDVRGHGESSTGWDDYSVAGVGSDMLALVRALKAGPAFLIGDSMSGGAAVYAAVEGAAEKLVAGMVLIDPFVRAGANVLLNLAMAVMFARPWGPGAWIRYYTTLYPTRKPPDFESYIAALQKNLSEPGRLEALRGMLFTQKTASAERLARVSVPALVLMGSQDPDFKDPAAEARAVARAIRGRVEMIASAGHYPHAELPESTGKIITAFLQSVQKQTHAAGR